MQNVEEQAIRQVIEKAYIEGIHGTQDEETVRSGFHDDFAMPVLQDGVLEKVSVEEWLHRIQGMKADNPEMWSAQTAGAQSE